MIRRLRRRGWGVTIQSCACALVTYRFRREKPTLTRDLACLNPGLTILPAQQPCAFRYSLALGYSQRLTKTGLAGNPSLVYARYVHSAPGVLMTQKADRDIIRRHRDIARISFASLDFWGFTLILALFMHSEAFVKGTDSFLAFELWTRKVPYR